MRIERIPVAALILQLSERPYPEWCRYKGQQIVDLDFAELRATDPDFVLFWMTRLMEQEHAFHRIVRGLPRDGSNTERWARRRLEQAREQLTHYVPTVD